MRTRMRWVLLVLTCLTCTELPTDGQVRPVNDRGMLGIERELRGLGTTASIMMIGAHPDDEDSALLAFLARGENARTAYLSLTRGDGGQNIIGPELFESLGVIRTEELLQARRLDGAEQYFTRAFDYGYSKTLKEARQKWDESVVLCDAVRAIRLFRPLVVISRFSGTPADGHGQHQFAGYISPMAVDAASDISKCRGSGDPWHVQKFYVEQGFGPGAQAKLQLNTGRYDVLLGRSYFELAMEGRSQHKSQGEGRLEYKGEFFSGLDLTSAVEMEEKSPFDGIDTSIIGIAANSGNSEEPVRQKLALLQAAVAKVKAARPSDDARSTLHNAAIAYKLAYDAEWSTRQPDTKALIRVVEDQLADLIKMVAGIQVDALSDRETVVPGDSIMSTVNVFDPRKEIVDVTEIKIKAPQRWNVGTINYIGQQIAAPVRREKPDASADFSITVPADASPTEPYWLRTDRRGDLYDWPNNDAQTLPFQPQEVEAVVTCKIGDVEIELHQPLEFRVADATRGEIRRNVDIVPALSVDVDQDLIIVPVSDVSSKRTLTVSVTNNSSATAKGSVSLNIASEREWKYRSSQPTFEVKRPGEKASIAFEIEVPANTRPGSYSIFPGAMSGEALASSKMHKIEYPHIQTHRYYTRAQAVVKVIDLKVRPVKVGYVMGSGDQVPEAISRLGADVTMLGENELSSGDLSRFDTIVVGIRASETRDDFVANNRRLLDFVNGGGNLIVQYQRPSFALQNLLPFQATIGPRVVDENARVTILAPDHPIFNTPNRITDADFDGWVQERNLYDLNTFDERYTPLLESHDEGEPENKGGLVIAGIGKGHYIYCSYALFRQLPAGVDGAYRLLANMISLGK